MANFLDFLRLNNIFNPPVYGNDLPSQGGITGNMPRPPVDTVFGGRIKSPFDPPRDIGFETLESPIKIGQPMNFQTDYQAPSPENDMASQVNRLYTPETRAGERFNTLLEGYPERPKPSKMRRITASLVGLENADKVLAGPRFAAEQEDWKTKAGPFGTAASIERSANVNERTMAMQTIANELRAQAQEAKARNDEINARIRQQRADVYEFKARNPMMRFDFTGPTVKIANPLTGQISDTGIPTGSLSDADKLALQQEMALERITATGEQARQTEGVRQSGRESIAETRGWQIYNVPDPARPGQMKAVKINQITGEVSDITDKVQKPIGPAARPSAAAGGGRPELATQVKVRQYNAARELYNTRADLRRFIQLGSPGTNDFRITPPNKSSFMGYSFNSGPTDEQYAEMQQAIYGMKPVASHETITTPESQPTTTKPKTGAAPQTPSGKSGDKGRPGGSVVEPSSGAPPPIEKRTVGMRHTFPNGNVGEWDGKKWLPIKVVTR